jgi:hypothetical protein
MNGTTLSLKVSDILSDSRQLGCMVQPAEFIKVTRNRRVVSMARIGSLGAERQIQETRYEIQHLHAGF